MSAAAEAAEEAVLLRYIAKFEDGARRPPVAQLYYKDTDEGCQKAEQFVRREDRKGYSIYSCIGLLRRMPRNKENVGQLPCLVLDIDLRNVVETREQVLQCLRGLLIPPNEIRDSGRGLHPIWHFKEPLTDDAGMAHAENIMKRLAALLAGDPEPTHRAALLRHLGSHNSKDDAWRECRIIEATSARNDISEFADMLDLYGDRPLLSRKPRPKTNGHARGSFEPANDGPVDVDARLAAMRFEGAGDSSIHRTQLQVTAALTSAGRPVAETVARVLAATRTAVRGDPACESWNWAEEEIAIARMCYDLINKALRQNGEDLGHCLPDGLHDAWNAAIAAGKRPNVCLRYGEFHVRGYPWDHKWPDDVVVGPWPGSTTDSTDSSSAADNEKTETDEAPGPDGRKRPAPPSLLGAAWYYGDPVPEQPPMLVPSFVPARGFGYLGGQWGTFKTFLLNDLAVAVASGGKFAGQQVTGRGVVIQIELEGSNNEARMLAAATVRRCEREALPIVHLKKEPPKILVNTQPNPRFREWMAQLVEYAKTVAAQFDLPLLLITIDPQSKVAGFKDEQSSSEGQVVSDAFAELARLAGCTVLVVDHFGKDQTAGLRGTSAKETNPLFILGTSEQQKDIYARRRLEIRKMRNGPSGAAIDFWMEDYEVVVQQVVRSETGTTTEPVSVKTLVICWGNELRAVGSTSEKKSGEVRPASGKALAILIEMIEEIGMALPEEYDAPAGGRGVTTAVWRQELIKQQVIGGKNPGAGFAKVRDGLLAHNEIGMDGEYVWVIPPPLDN